MRKIQEVLRLRYELKLSCEQIGRSCAIGASTVHKYLKRAEAAGLSWPLPEGWNEERVEAALYPRAQPAVVEKNPSRTPPDFAALHEQLRQHRHPPISKPANVSPPGLRSASRARPQPERERLQTCHCSFPEVCHKAPCTLLVEPNRSLPTRAHP